MQPIRIIGELSTLPPVEQHKADLEMIIARCDEALLDRIPAEAATAWRLRKLAQALLDRIPTEKPALVEHKTTNYPDSAICYDLSCEWRERGPDAHEQAIAHARETGHPVNVETMRATMYQPSALGRVEDNFKCPGCFGAGTGARCCICGGVR
jgi:hypothetical protein